MTANVYGAADRLMKTGDTATGTLILTGSPALQIPAGAANGDVLTSDASGNASWQQGVTAALGWVSVTAYGAVGDGSTDNTTAFQNALNAAAPSGPYAKSTTVWVPPGFWVTGPLTIPHGVTLQGAGPRATTLIAKAGSAAGPLLTNATHAEMVCIADLRLQGNASNQTSTVHGIEFSGAWAYSSATDEYNELRCRVENVHIETFNGDGLRSLDRHDSIFTNIQVWYCSGTGVYSTGDDYLSDIDCGECGADGFLVAGNAVVSNCKAWMCGWINGAPTVTSTSATTGNGFHVTSTTGGSMASCYAQDCGRAGFYFDGCSRVVATGLCADSNNNNSSSTGFAGVEVANAAGPLTISALSWDRGANTQHQAAAARLDPSSPPAGVDLRLNWLSNAYMSALFTADTSTAVLNANNVTAVASTGGGQTVHGPQTYTGVLTASGGWKLSSNLVHAAAFGAVGDYTTDDTAALQSAIDTVSAAGGGTVIIGQHVVSGSGINPKSNVTIAGIPGYSKLKNSTSNAAISSSVACSNIGFRDFTVEGPVTNTVTVPTRARTTSGAGTTTGIWLDGSLDTTASGAPVITDVTIRNVTVQNCTSLPIRVFGITGRVLVEGCSFYNCMDAGFAFNQEVICSSNHSLMSADNGFSLSRGNQKVTCTGNTVELAAYHGIWLSGFTGSVGPDTFSCTGNTVLNVGECGILLQDAPKYGTVSGNTINKGYYRGEAGAPTDNYVAGIMVRGSSATPSSPGTSIAYGLKITGNTVIGAPEAGILYDGATSVAITDNLILDCGTEYLADGTTVITSSYTSQNVGILCDYTSTAAASIVRNNDVIDQRATPYCNWGLYPVHVPGVTAVGNTMTGCRNSSNLPAALSTYTAGYMDSGQETLKRTEINASSITMVSGILRLAYFVARRNSTVTALKAWSGSTAAGATPTLVQFGLYSVASSGDLTLLSSTANDTTVFAATSTAYQRNLTAAQTLQADQTYAIGVLVVTTATAPTVLGNNIVPTSDAQLSPVLANNLSGQTGLPASITAASLSATASVVYGIAVGG